MVSIMESFEEIKQKSHSVVLEVLPNVSSEELLDNRDLFSMGLDSITAMTLVLNLQDAFGVSFDSGDINFENFQTLSNIVELIKRKQEVSIPL